MPHAPFIVFPWQRPFLPDLKRAIHEWTQAKPWECTVIVPHNRPKAYLTELYRDEKRMTLLPKVITIEELTLHWLLENDVPLLPKASLWDMVFLLFHVVKGMNAGFLHERFHKMDALSFWPWGMHLAKLFEEFYRQGLLPENVTHVEDTVSPNSEALLTNLGEIAKRYREELDRHALSTRGLDLLRASQGKNIPHVADTENGRIVLIAGISVLEGAEERLLKRLWNNGVRLCLHTDPSLGTGSCRHAAKAHEDLLRKWKAKTELFGEDTSHTPQYHFFEGYDCHSELLAIERDLSRTKEKESVAIVLSQSDMLMPLLHHLPRKKVNISMGYPVKRTMLGQFLQILFTLHERTKDKRCYARDLLHFLRHPAVEERLRREEMRESDDAVMMIEKVIVEGERFQDVHTLLDVFSEMPNLRSFFQELFRLAIDDLGKSACLKDFARALRALLDFLYPHPPLSPIELEALVFLKDKALHELGTSLYAALPIPFLLQKLIAGSLFEEERVPFEDRSETTCLQILGLLETRLLHFDTVYFLDATDDALPGVPSQDILLPEPLRRQMGLLPYEAIEARAAYNAYRLCAASKDVYFYFQEGVSGGGQDKKNRSRYIEQLIWEEEQKRGRLLAADEPPLEIAHITIVPPVHAEKSIDLSPNMERVLLLKLEDKGLSSTRMDEFLLCPLKFARSYILGLAQKEDINEEDDAPSLVGTWIHDLMQRLYSPRIGQIIDETTFDDEAIEKAITGAESQEFLSQIPPLAYFAAKEAANVHLKKYLKNQTPTVVLECEKFISRTMSDFSRPVKLTGKLDRIDKREDGIWILDYKTGMLKTPKKSFWNNQDILTKISQMRQGEPSYEQLCEMLDCIREDIKSLQLPVYVTISEKYCREQHHENVTDCALIDLGGEGREVPFFGDASYSITEKRTISYDLVWLLVSTLLATRRFSAIESDNCDWCPYKELCNL